MRYIKTGRSYLICRGKCDFSADHCFDLVGEPEHLQVLDESIEMMRSQNLVNDRTTVSKVFEFIKQKVGNFPYQAIRAFGILSQSDTREDMAKYRRTIIFEYGKYQYLDYRPAIQICLLKKTSLGFRDYCVVYPDEYNIDYVI